LDFSVREFGKETVLSVGCCERFPFWEKEFLNLKGFRGKQKMDVKKIANQSIATSEFVSMDQQASDVGML